MYLQCTNIDVQENRIFTDSFNEEGYRMTIGLVADSFNEISVYQEAVWRGVSDAAREQGIQIRTYVGGALEYSPLNPFEKTKTSRMSFWILNNWMVSSIVEEHWETVYPRTSLTLFVNGFRRFLP